MRRRAWIAWACLLVGIVFGILGRVLAGADTWNLLAGLFFLAAIVLGVSLLSLGKRILPGLRDFPDLFDRPRPGERWCASCGHPAGAQTACKLCGSPPTSPRRDRPRVQAK